MMALYGLEDSPLDVARKKLFSSSQVGNRAKWDNIAGGLPGEEYGGGLRAVCFTGNS